MPKEPETLDDVPAALRRLGWGGIAQEWELMQEVLAFYANDEDRTLREEGEPYGSIPTEVGIKARQHRASFQRREAAAKPD
jgi:hypothetical protein